MIPLAPSSPKRGDTEPESMCTIFAARKDRRERQRARERFPQQARSQVIPRVRKIEAFIDQREIGNDIADDR